MFAVTHLHLITSSHGDMDSDVIPQFSCFTASSILVNHQFTEFKLADFSHASVLDVQEDIHDAEDRMEDVKIKLLPYIVPPEVLT